MNDGLKQRIIGAMVLVALGIIFLPVLFDKERIAPVDRQTQIPLAPDIVPSDMPSPPVRVDDVDPKAEVEKTAGSFRVQELDKSDAADQDSSQQASADDKAPAAPAAQASESKVTPAKEVSAAKPTMSPKGVYETWVLQVASFGSSSYAEKLRDKLLADDYKAFIKKVTTAKGEFSRVYVGPSMDRDRLLEAKRSIEKKYALKTSLAKYSP